VTDQVSLPVTFPPGTELPVKGKVEVTNNVNVTVTNAEIPVKITNLELPVTVTNTPNVKVTNEFLETHVGQFLGKKVGESIPTTVTNEPTVKGKVEVTNVVKVEGVATASQITVKSAAGAEELKINNGRLLVTQGMLLEKFANTILSGIVKVKFPTKEKGTYVVQSIACTFSKASMAEKTAYIFVMICNGFGGEELWTTRLALGEQPGTGAATVSIKVVMLPNVAQSISWINQTTRNCYLIIPLPDITFGPNQETEYQLAVETTGEVGITGTVAGKTTIRSNEGTL
jgi:hypothetical protein